MNDVVYIIGPGERPWLRYSLRSLANLPHGRVFVIGERPAFLSTAVTYLPVQRHPIKWRSAVNNLRRACSEYEISPDFTLMNDDFFITRPIESVPVYHRGLITDVLADTRQRVPYFSKYQKGMEESRRVLGATFGLDKPVSYSLHVPFTYNRYRLLETLDVSDRIRRRTVEATDTRTMYGNMWRIGGRRVRDVKISRFYPAVSSDLPFRSSDPWSWERPHTEFIRELFPTPSPYERP